MFGAILLDMPFPLLPIQILWVNLVTDGLPAIALGMDPAERGIMVRPPRPPKDGIFSRGLGWKITLQGLMIGVATLIVFLMKLGQGNLILARTAAFSALVFSQMMFVFRCRSEYQTMFQIKILENRYLVGAVLLSTLMQLSVVYLPWFQKIFYTVSLNFKDWIEMITILVVTTFFSDIIFQFRKILRRHLSFFRFSLGKK